MYKYTLTIDMFQERPTQKKLCIKLPYWNQKKIKKNKKKNLNYYFNTIQLHTTTTKRIIITLSLLFFSYK